MDGVNAARVRGSIPTGTTHAKNGWGGGGVRNCNTARTDDRRGGFIFYFTTQRSGAIPKRSGAIAPNAKGVSLVLEVVGTITI